MSASKSADTLILQLKALAHPLRFHILELLKSGEMNVGQIEAASNIVQPSLSQQLGVLRKAGLVETRKEAKLVFYRRAEVEFAALSDAIRNRGIEHAKGYSQAREPAPGAANFARLS